MMGYIEKMSNLQAFKTNNAENYSERLKKDHIPKNVIANEVKQSLSRAKRGISRDCHGLRPRNDFVGLPRLRAVTHFGVQARRFAPRNDNFLWTYTLMISYFHSRRSRIRPSLSVRVPLSMNSSLSILTVHISLKTFSNSLSSLARSCGPASTFRVK